MTGPAAWGAWVLGLALCSGAASAGSDRFAFSDRDDGISCSYFDVRLAIPWRTGGAAWIDADGKATGARAFAAHAVEAHDVQRVRRIDVSALVQGWWRGRWPNDGLLVRSSADGPLLLHAREAPDAALRPQLVLRWAGGRSRYLEAAADASLDCSTYRGLGPVPTLSLDARRPLAMRFDLRALQAAQPVPDSAELILVRTADSRPQRAALGVYRLAPPMAPAGAAEPPGLAARYPGDRGIADDPDVLFADGFDGGQPDRRWSVNREAPGRVVAGDDGGGFVPLAGPALRITIPRNGLLGLDMRYRLRDARGVEPEEVYFRYHLRLARDWLAAVDGGKLPGLAATYGEAGWGGRPWDGRKGWSLRGSFGTTPPPGHAAAGRIMLGTYAYHARSGTYGEGLVWSDGDLAGLIEPDRWYSIEQHIRLNTPGQEDGVLRVWVDGRLALHRSDLRLRDLPTIRIEEVWMNFYHGGTQPAPQAMNAYVDNVVVARRKIGPMSPRGQ